MFTDRASGKDTARPELDALIGFVREGDTVRVQGVDTGALAYSTVVSRAGVSDRCGSIDRTNEQHAGVSEPVPSW